MRKRGLIALGLAASAAVASIAGAASSPGDRNGGATARAYAVQIVLPNHEPVVKAQSAAPPAGTGFEASYQAPADGSVMTTGALTSAVSAQPGQTATATAASSVTSLSIFNGELTADAVSARATATATPSSASGDLSSGTGFTNLTVLGQVVPQPTPNQRLALGDWGYAILLEQPQAPSASQGYHGFVTALDIHLTADHGDLPAGSEIQVGYAEVDAQPAPATSPATAAQPSGPGLPAVPSASGNPPEPRANGLPPVIQAIPKITPALTAGGYVFPVYGPVSYGDTFGAPRADVGWHHGDDLFGQLGQPLLAVASGTVFAVGWNDIGGNRLWLRDAQGNEFYYAHLSAFSPLAVNGAQVHAGDVLGFMGQTGDAEGTPIHLHFEIHPVGLLPLGYDGAVDPTSYLEAWQHQEDLSFATASGFSPAGSLAPEPGAILLQANDISSANGLEPGSLQRAMAPISSEGDAALVGGLPPAARAAAAGDLGKG